jgi:hypothetical protein
MAAAPASTSTRLVRIGSAAGSVPSPRWGDCPTASIWMSMPGSTPVEASRCLWTCNHTAPGLGIYRPICVTAPTAQSDRCHQAASPGQRWLSSRPCRCLRAKIPKGSTNQIRHLRLLALFCSSILARQVRRAIILVQIPFQSTVFRLRSTHHRSRARFFLHKGLGLGRPGLDVVPAAKSPSPSREALVRPVRTSFAPGESCAHRSLRRHPHTTEIERRGGMSGR